MCGSVGIWLGYSGVQIIKHTFRNKLIYLQAGTKYKSWESKGFRIVKECVQKLAESLAHEVVKQGTQKVIRSDAEQWLFQNVTFTRMLENVFLHLFYYRASKHHTQSLVHDVSDTRMSATITKNITTLLPFCDGLHYVPDYPAFTDISQMLFINEAIPDAYRNKWRFLFSSQIHGESFSTLLGRIMNQGPSVVIVEDTDGYIYGGFASASWSFSPKFVGDSTSFLFTLRPKMRVYGSTGYNANYQYLNLHQQTMPNGMVIIRLGSTLIKRIRNFCGIPIVGFWWTIQLLGALVEQRLRQRRVFRFVYHLSWLQAAGC